MVASFKPGIGRRADSSTPTRENLQGQELCWRPCRTLRSVNREKRPRWPPKPFSVPRGSESGKSDEASVKCSYIKIILKYINNLCVAGVPFKINRLILSGVCFVLSSAQKKALIPQIATKKVYAAFMKRIDTASRCFDPNTDSRSGTEAAETSETGPENPTASDTDSDSVALLPPFNGFFSPLAPITKMPTIPLPPPLKPLEQPRPPTPRRLEILKHLNHLFLALLRFSNLPGKHLVVFRVPKNSSPSSCQIPPNPADGLSQMKQG
jgi:hypothetical protein